MAIFDSKPKKEIKKVVAKAPKAPKAMKAKKTKVARKVAGAPAKAIADSRLEYVLKAPWLSEKALIGTEKGVYVFEVPAEATKLDVKRAVERIFKVVPRKVNMLHLPGKKKPLRKKRGQGTRAERHKAYVFLQKGETIQFS